MDRGVFTTPNPGPVAEQRRGDWMQTYTGIAFWPLDPRPGEVHIQDIAHALSMKCRYAGHCSRFYSVAEHSVLVSRAVAPEFALWGLLHDAAEAYSADIPRPIKRYLRDWEGIESSIMEAVCRRFGLPLAQPDAVGWADAAILADEQAELMAPAPRPWNLPFPPLGVRVAGYAPDAAYLAFMARFEELQP